MSKKISWCCFIKNLFSKQTLPQQRQLKGRLKTTNPEGLSSPKGKLSDSEVLESINKCESEAPRCTNVVTDDKSNIFTLNPRLKSHADHHQAATKIQTSYRGHLARKALRALKGLVTLQAIIRGRAVRRQAADMLKCLQSIVNIQSEICARRRLMTPMCRSNLLSQDIITQNRMIEEMSNCELPTKDLKINTYTISKKKEDQRNSTDSVEKDDPQDRVKHLVKQYLDRNPRRSNKNKTCNNEHIPSYMAATKSTRAKAVSLTSPRCMAMNFDAYSDGDSPYKIKFSPISSINKEIIRSSHTVSDTKNTLQ